VAADEGVDHWVCVDCRLLQARTPTSRCAICDDALYRLKDRPAAIFQPVERVRLGRRPEPTGLRKWVLSLATVAVLPFALIGSGFIARALPPRYQDELLAWLILVVFVGPMIAIGAVGYLRTRRRKLGLRATSTSRWPAQLRPAHDPVLRGVAHAANPGTETLLTTECISPLGEPTGLLLRTARCSELVVQSEAGESVRIVGPTHLVTEGMAGEPCDAPLSSSLGIGDTIGLLSVFRHQLNDGDRVEIWGEVSTEQRSDGYRDAPTRVLRGVPGRPILLRRVS
jgi:hypothetical protein